MIQYSDVKYEVEEGMFDDLAKFKAWSSFLPKSFVDRALPWVAMVSMAYRTFTSCLRESQSVELWGETRWRSFKEASSSRREQKMLAAEKRLMEG